MRKWIVLYVSQFSGSEVKRRFASVSEALDFSSKQNQVLRVYSAK